MPAGCVWWRQRMRCLVQFRLGSIKGFTALFIALLTSRSRYSKKPKYGRQGRGPGRQGAPPADTPRPAHTCTWTHTSPAAPTCPLLRRQQALRCTLWVQVPGSKGGADFGKSVDLRADGGHHTHLCAQLDGRWQWSRGGAQRVVGPVALSTGGCRIRGSVGCCWCTADGCAMRA